jgi:gamma-glutamyltranspeptidase/glutathione hydrolase
MASRSTPHTARGAVAIVAVLLLPAAFLSPVAIGSPAPAAPAVKPPAPPPYPPPKEPLHAAHAAVASDHPLASAAGVAALKAGGNAVDAACAAALALGVLHPDSSGIGGGGFALIWIAKEKKAYALDFRERAPSGITAARFLKDGQPVPGLSSEGGLAVAVPGEVRGLGDMVKKWGKRPWSACVDPAQKMAAKGVPVSWRLARTLEGLSQASTPPADPTFAKMFVSAKPPAEKSILKRPELAATLAKLKAKGPDAFYKGPIADEIVKAISAAGGVMTAQDLAAYASTERTPLETTYRGLRVVTMPPASSGGVALVEALGILGARYPKPGDLPPARESGPYLHTVAEAFKHAFADRARFLGDTDFVTVDLPRLTSPGYAAELAKRIKPAAVLASDAYGTLGGPPARHKDGGTTHISVVDAAGNAVALTTTINLSFGAKLVAGKTGILLNDEMDDFVMQVGVPNQFGLIGNEQNAVAPNKRPLSSMTPTVVLEGDKVKLVVGGAGGPNIITSTLQVLLNVVDWNMDAQAAVTEPRIHHQWFPDMLGVETAVPKEATAALEKDGHKLKEVPISGKVNLVVRTAKGLDAASEFRSPSGPAGY